MKHTFLSLFLLFTAAICQAQDIDTLGQYDLPLYIESYLEDYFQSIESESDEFDFNTLYDDLAFYYRRPLNLNKAEAEELEELRLLNTLQIDQLLQYREELGPLLVLEELQAVPGFDLGSIRRILPFVKVSGKLDDYNIGLSELIKGGNNTLFLRWTRDLEKASGFLPKEETGVPQFEGDPNQYYLRWRYAYGNRLSAGITAEKDRGEAFFKGSNSEGFDFYSAHIFLKDYNYRLKSLALGDYVVSFGQGLVVHAGFGGRKSSQVMDIKKSGRSLRQYSSVNEEAFLRGAAATVRLNDQLEVTAFGSYRKRDGNLVFNTDTLELQDAVQEFSSFLDNGLHRTDNEIADENTIGQTTIGGRLQFKKRGFQISANALYDQFDSKLNRRQQPYNQFLFSNDRLLNMSVDYSFTYRNINFFGETAMSDNGVVATLNGMIIGLDPTLDFAALYRYLPRNYHALNSNIFAESAAGNNEEGLYLALEYRPSLRWRLSAYYDMYRHPWLRFRVDAPSSGHEARLRLTYYEKRRLDIYVELRREIKQLNAPDPDAPIDYLQRTDNLQFRLHIGNKLSKAFELRSRINIGYFDDETERLDGFQVHQDVIVKPIGSPFQFSARYAFFDTDGFDVRFYNYESALLYQFAIPAYFDKGTRYYLNVRYKGVRNLTLEARFAQTRFFRTESVGSGLNEIPGQTRTSVGAQIKFDF